MANKKTLQKSLEIRKSLLDGFTIIGIPSSWAVLACGCSFLVGYKTHWLFGVISAVFLLVSLYTIHRKDPRALTVYINMLGKGEVMFSSFKQTHQRIVVKDTDGSYRFLNK